MSTMSRWLTPISADWARSLELVGIAYETGLAKITVREENYENHWLVTFQSVQGLRVTAWECSGKILSDLPLEGGMFEADDSIWLCELGKGAVPFLNSSRHYVILCYDEIIQVVASEVHISEWAPPHGEP